MPYLLPDGAPTRCGHMNLCDPPQFWTDCESLADEKIDSGEQYRFNEWQDEHPKAIIMLQRHGNLYLCKKHANLWRDLV